MENVFQKMQSSFTDLASKTSEFIENAELEAKFKAVGDKTKKVVREYPLESVLAGVALGFLIGRLFRRNDG
jgi:ElaB/YqjD/DUF883 family membrane-anchored ribosome-binding protein